MCAVSLFKNKMVHKCDFVYMCVHACVGKWLQRLSTQILANRNLFPFNNFFVLKNN